MTTSPLAHAAIARARSALDIASRDAPPVPEYPFAGLVSARQKGDHVPWLAQRMHDDYLGRGYVPERGGLFVDPRAVFGRALTVAGSGGNLVQTGVQELLNSDELGAVPQVVRAGATLLANLEGNAKVPALSTTGTASWISTEGNSPSQDTAQFTENTLSPKSLTAWIDISRMLRRTSGVDLDRMIARYFGRAMARAIDRAALVGDPVATPGSPRGIAQTSGVGSVAMGTNGNPLTRARLREFFEDVAASNALRPASRFGFVMNTATAASAYNIETSTGSGRYLFEPDGADSTAGKLGGYPAYIDNALPANGTKGTSAGVCSTLVAGDWSEVIIASWGPIEIVVDTFTRARSGTTRLVALWAVDCAVAHPAAFTIATDVTTP